MSNEFKDRAKWLKNKKIGFAAVIVAAIYVLLIGSLLIGATTARYKETRTLYSNFEPAAFNAVILGQEKAGMTYQSALADLKGTNLYAFAEEFNSLNFRPGETRELPFSIANGTLSANVSNVDMVYSIKLRTNGNIPLTYRLKWTTTEKSDGATREVTKEYAPSEPQKVNLTNTEGDSQWNVYSFYEVTDNGSGEEIVSETEATFPLPGNDLDLNLHAFTINWPIVDTGNSKPSNDTSYMKEVEVMEVFVTVTGLNETDSKTEVDAWPETGEAEYFTTGIVFLLDGNEYKLDQLQTKDYEIDYRAFYSEEELPTYFKLELDDGIKSVSAPSEELKKITPKSTEYSVELLVPVGIEEEFEIEGDYSNAGYQYTLNTKDGALQKYSSEYIILNVHDQTEKPLESVTNDDEAIYYWRQDENKDREYIYRVDKFCIPGKDEYIAKNENQRRNPTTGDIDKIVGYKDPITIVLTDLQGRRIAPESIPGTFSVDHKLYLRVKYKYS